jgi:hypothetical protein
MNLSLHKVRQIKIDPPELLTNSMGKDFALRRIHVITDRGTFEIVAFADAPSALEIVFEEAS